MTCLEYLARDHCEGDKEVDLARMCYTIDWLLPPVDPHLFESIRVTLSKIFDKPSLRTYCRWRRIKGRHKSIVLECYDCCEGSQSRVIGLISFSMCLGTNAHKVEY